VKIIHFVLFETRVAIVNVTEPPLRGLGSCGDGSFLNLQARAVKAVKLGRFI